jgi:hypothetical protein
MIRAVARQQGGREEGSGEHDPNHPHLAVVHLSRWLGAP